MSTRPAANSQPVMDYTARMVALLGRMRRERNGAVADAMRLYGARYGLNYGVSLPTVRQIARAEGTDEAFARLLWQQDVRELQLAALHIADPEQLHEEQAASWAAGIRNSELAEEAAFVWLRRAPRFAALFDRWIADASPLLRYAALLGGARQVEPSAQWIAPALQAVAHAPEPFGRLLAQGAVALLEAIGRRDATSRQAVLRAVDSAAASGDRALAEVREELAWRLAG